MKLNDKDDLRALRARVESILSQELGLAVSIGNMTFDRNGNFVKFPVEVIAGKSREQLDLENEMAVRQLRKTGTDSVLGELMLVGYNRRARKYPFIARDLGGKEYKLPLDTAIRVFGGVK